MLTVRVEGELDAALRALERRGEVVPVERVGGAREARAVGRLGTRKARARGDVPERIHELVGKVAVAEHHVVLESAEVIEEPEFVEEDVEKASTRNAERSVDRALKSGDVAVFQGCALCVSVKWRSGDAKTN